MLEKSVLRLDEIPELLSSQYDFSNVSVIEPLKGGSANLWTVRCDGRLKVLKEFQSRYSATDVHQEPEINSALEQKGLPVVSFVETSCGNFIWSFRERVFHLQEYAEDERMRGRTF